MASNTNRVGSGERILLKIVMVGESGVGKTRLLKAFRREDFSQTWECRETVGMDFEKVSIDIDGKEVILHTWDTSGQEKFNNLCPLYFREANGVVLVYGINERKTFDQLSKWWKEIEKYAPDNVHVIVVGNKIDLEDRQVTKREGLQFANLKRALFIETTATKKEGVGHVLEKLVRKILPQHVSYPKPDTINLSQNSYDVAVSTERSCWDKWC